MSSEASESNARTLASYEAAADRYAERQPAATPTELLAFLDAIAGSLPPSGRVLEIGSATGHDAALLEARGLRVHRTDATRAFVEQLRSRGLQAEILNVITDELGGPWDGVYANAVLLHLDASELAGVLAKTAGAVVPGGVLGFTVKEGDGAGWSTAKLDHPRHFTYWRPAPLRVMLDSSPWDLIGLERVAGAGDDWLYCLCRRPRTSGPGTQRPTPQPGPACPHANGPPALEPIPSGCRRRRHRRPQTLS
jgi:SAM-dependent methyltransferase